MNVLLVPYQDEHDELIALLTGQRWPYHSMPELSRDTVLEQIEGGRYASNESQRTYWITVDEIHKVGVLRVFDMEDPTPLFDIRISETWRGRGIGAFALRQLANLVFTEDPGKIRIEGHTRVDNLAMRKTFVNAGFVKEGVHRRAWTQNNGAVYDSVSYAIIRDDWEDGSSTPIIWDDVPF